MARKTINELRTDALNKLKDNSSGDITASVLRSLVVDFIDTMQPGYCAAVIKSPPMIREITKDAPVVLDIFDQVFQPLDNIFAYDGSGVVTMQSPSVLRVTVNLAAEFAQAQEIAVSVGQAGAATIWKTDAQGRGNGKPVPISLPNCLIEASSGQTITVLCQSEDNDKTVTFVDGAFVCEYVPMIDTAPADPRNG